MPDVDHFISRWKIRRKNFNRLWDLLEINRYAFSKEMEWTGDRVLLFRKAGRSYISNEMAGQIVNFFAAEFIITIKKKRKEVTDLIRIIYDKCKAEKNMFLWSLIQRVYGPFQTGDIRPSLHLYIFQLDEINSSGLSKLTVE